MKIGITERGDAALDYSEALSAAVFKKVDGIILITKNPGKLLSRLETAEPTIPFIIHCSITGFGSELIEPNVPKPEDALKAYHKLINRYGKQNIVLRVDPIWLLDKAMPIIYESEGRTRISFGDAYPHVRRRFMEKAPTYLPLLPTTFHFPTAQRQDWLKQINHTLGYYAEVCGEPDLPCTGCVSPLDLKAMGITETPRGKSTQRFSCACIAEKTELLSRQHPCPHGCLYCYWKD